MRRATPRRSLRQPVAPDFYPRSPCGERRVTIQVCNNYNDISIHALLAESDFSVVFTTTRPPSFLSTLSLRRATTRSSRASTASWNFYPRSPCGERLGAENLDRSRKGISIHALLAESDFTGRGTSTRPNLFLSTLSLRRATASGAPYRQAGKDFYPRSPCGERRWTAAISRRGRWLFLSTLSLRRATVQGTNAAIALGISIHALLAESDTLAPRYSSACCYFYPRSPCGERRCSVCRGPRLYDFYPRSPCGERPLSRSTLGESS